MQSKPTSRFQTFIFRVGEFILARPWVSVGLCFLSFLALSIPIYSLKSDYGVRIWFRTTDPLIKDLDALEKKFGSDERIIVGIHNPKGVFTPEMVKMMQEVTEKVWQVPQVVRVDSLTNYNYTVAEGDDLITEPFLPEDSELTSEELAEKKKTATSDSLLLNQFVDKEGKTALIHGSLIPDIGGGPNYQKIVSGLKEILKPYEEKNSETRVIIGGSGAYNDAYREVSENDLATLIPVILGVMVFFLIYIFRTWEGVVLPMLLVGASVLATLGISALLGMAFNNLSSALPGILIAICMADSVHILATYYKKLNEGLGSKQATMATILKNFLPTLITSVSTSIGFLSLTQTELIPVKELGVLAAFGTMYAWVLTIFGVCPLLPLIPYRPFRKRRQVSESFSVRYLNWIDRYKVYIVSLISVTALGAVYVGMQNKVSSDPLKHFDTDLRIYQDAHFLLDTFEGLGGPEIVISSGRPDGIKNPAFLHKVDEFEKWLLTLPKTNQVVSIVKIIKHLNQKLHGDDPSYYKIPDNQNQVAEILLFYTLGLPQGMDLNNRMSLDNESIRLTLFWGIHDSQLSLELMEKIKAKLEELNLDGSITGKLILYNRMVDYIVVTFFKSISLALFLISLLMIFILRSWRLGLLSLLPNVVPLTYGAAVMTILERPVDVATSLVMSVCLGIAVDDTIHFLTHLKDRLIHESDLKTALSEVFKNTAPALVFTTLILTISFGLFMTANFMPNINFGILCSIILTMALVIDLVYLPAILLIFKVEK